MIGQIYCCNDNSPKKFKVTFSSGLLANDTWLLCCTCNRKPEFQNYRISETFLKLGENYD